VKDARNPHILSCGEAVPRHRRALVNVAESNTRRLVNIDDVRILTPPILIVHSPVAILIDQTRSILLQHANHPGSAWSASKPQQQRILRRLVLRLEVPEEDMLGADVQPPSVLLRAGITEGRVLLLSDADGVVFRELTLECLEPFQFWGVLEGYLGERHSSRCEQEGKELHISMHAKAIGIYCSSAKHRAKSTLYTMGDA